MKQTLSNCKILYGQWNVSGEHNEVALDYAVKGEPGPAFGDTTEGQYPGLATVKLGAAGYADYSGIADPLAYFPNVGVAGTPITVAPGVPSGAEGEPCYFFKSLVSEFDPLAGVSVGGLAKFKLSASASDVASPIRLVRGTILRNVLAPAAGDGVTGNGTIFQLGPVAAGQRFYYAAHIVGVAGGSPTLTLDIQSAAAGGFGSPTTRYTSGVFGAAGWDWAVVSGPITDAFWRVQFAIGGSSPAFQYAVVAGII